MKSLPVQLDEKFTLLKKAGHSVAEFIGLKSLEESLVKADAKLKELKITEARRPIARKNGHGSIEITESARSESAKTSTDRVKHYVRGGMTLQEAVSFVGAKDSIDPTSELIAECTQAWKKYSFMSESEAKTLGSRLVWPPKH